VVLDEAGMASTDDLDRLVRLVRTRGWRLVCVGDPDQLPAVGRGGMFAHWCDTLPAHHLDQVHRFTEPWQAEASLALRRGDPAAVGAYVAMTRGRLRNIAVVLDPTGLADPAEVLEQTIAKPASAETAHATRDRLGGPEPGTLTLAPTAIDVALARLDHSRNRGPDRSLGL
jgi:hypothetical protein